MADTIIMITTIADHAASGSRIVEAPLFCVVPLGDSSAVLYADRLYAMLEPIVK